MTGATELKITNLSLTLADTEYSHSVVNNCRCILVKSRTLALLKIAFTLGESGTKLITLPAGTTLELNDLTLSGKIMYVQSPSSSVVVEILETF